MSNICISVVIPTKNRIHYLLETIANINAQTFKPEEIIVIDDGSTDGTERVLKEKKIENLIYLRNKKAGPGAARNLGLEVARGRYIQFFDSDDLMTLNKLEVQCELLRSSGVGMAYSPYIMASLLDGEWQFDCILNRNPIPRSKSLRYRMVRGWNIITQACLFERDLLNQIGGWDESIYTHEDYLYLFKLSELVRTPVFSDACAVLYRQHTYQLTDAHSNAIDKVYNLHYALKEILQCDLDYLDRFVLKTRLYQNQKYGLKKYKYNVLGELGDLRLRLEYKMGRLRTGTRWQPMHGPSKDYDLFMSYISNLK